MTGCRHARRTPWRPGLGLTGLTAVLLGLAGLAASEPAPPADIAVAVDGGRLTVDVRNAPLADVLRLVGEEAGVRISIRGTLDARITRAFADIPVAEGIERLVRGYASGVSYTFARDPTGAEVLSEAWVTGASASRPSPPRVDPAARARQLRAVRELTRQRDPGAVTTLARMLAEDSDPLVRARAAAALASVGGSQAAAALMTALGDAAPSVRMQVVRAVARVDAQRAAASLRGVLLGDPDPRVRRVAALTLASLRSEEARRALEAATTDPDASVRRAVALALSRWQRRQR